MHSKMPKDNFNKETELEDGCLSRTVVNLPPDFF